MAQLSHILRIAFTVARKLPRGGVLALELCKTFVLRFHQKGPRSAWYYLRYYVNNLYVSFCNCHFTTTRVCCPCCGWRGYDFIPQDGVVFWSPRMVCPSCLAYDRHRAFHLYATRHDNRLLKTAGLTIHIAPETYVAALATTNTEHHYVATDLDRNALAQAGAPAFQADVLHLPIADGKVDTLICFHVLEHIADDRAAAAELHRILRSNGVAYIMVPLNLALEKSFFFEKPNPDIFDHYWAPGRDYQEHLSVFSQCAALTPLDYLSEEEAFRYGTPRKEVIFVCRKNG